MLSSVLIQDFDRIYGAKKRTVAVRAVNAQHSTIFLNFVSNFFFLIAFISALKKIKKAPKRPPNMPRITKNGKS